MLQVETLLTILQSWNIYDQFVLVLSSIALHLQKGMWLIFLVYVRVSNTVYIGGELQFMHLLQVWTGTERSLQFSESSEILELQASQGSPLRKY